MEVMLVRNKNKFQQGGFTLIELLIVIAIIGILSSIVLVSLNSARGKARDAKRVSELKQIQKAIEMYYNDYGYYPTCGGKDVCSSTGYSGSISTLLSVYGISIPNDPINESGSYGYYYARTYKKTGNSSLISTGLKTDYILATRLESLNRTFSGWNNGNLNWLEGNWKYQLVINKTKIKKCTTLL